VLKGEFAAIILTGGMAHSTRLVKTLKKYISFLGKVIVIPGEFEMEALASGVARVLSGTEKAKEY
jgi:butyrate kinase